MAKQPIKFTIVTVTYNAGPLMARTIRSVEQQDYPLVEHLIIDGNSTDNTLEQVHHYMERNSNAEVKHEINCLSEPDHGIYDAMNKALGLMTGRYVLFLNAGDTLHERTTLSRVAAAVQDETRQPAVVYGLTNLVDADGRFLRPRRLAPPADETLTWQHFRAGMLVCHQAFFARTDLAHETLYDRTYRFSADYDWCIRIMKEADKRKMKLLGCGFTVADYLNEGTTTRNHRRSLLERLRIMATHYGWPTAIAEHFWFIIRAIIKQ